MFKRSAQELVCLFNAAEKTERSRELPFVPIGVSADQFPDQWLVEAILNFALPERVIFKFGEI